MGANGDTGNGNQDFHALHKKQIHNLIIIIISYCIADPAILHWRNMVSGTSRLEFDGCRKCLDACFSEAADSHAAMERCRCPDQ